MENVNKQLLDAAKALVSALNDAMPHMDTGHDGVGPDCTKQFQALIDGSQAIAAAEQAQQAEPVAADPAVAAIQFALETHSDGLHFLRLWNEGEFDLLRREWPEAPEDIYIGADPLLEAPAQPPAVAVAVAVAVPDGWDAESVRLAFSTLRYILGLKPDGIKAPCDHVQDIIDKVASWSDMGPCHPVRKQYEAAAAHRAMLAAAQKGGA